MKFYSSDANTKAEASRFFAKVFSQEPFYRHQLKFDEADLCIVYETLLDLVFSSKENVLVTAKLDNKIVGAGVFASPRWQPGLLNFLVRQFKMFTRLGFSKSISLSRFIYGVSPPALSDLWHLLLLATDKDHRKKGCATGLINYFVEHHMGNVGSGIYLEALKNSPAKDFYLKRGFTIAGENIGKDFYFMTLSALNPEAKKAA